MIKRFAISLFHTIIRSNLGLLAAAIAFFGFSSMIPILLLAVIVTTHFLPPFVVESFLIGTLHSYLPALPGTMNIVPATVQRLEQVDAEVRVIGLLGTLWSIVGGFVSVQFVLDTIWGIRKRRSFLRQYLVGFVMLAILLSLTLASALVTEVPPRLLHHLALPPLVWYPMLRVAALLLFPLLLFVTCFVVYSILPSRTLPLPSRLIGAGVATAGIYISRSLFAIYTHHLGQYQTVYGALSFIMLLTFWIYIVTVITLVGGAIAVSIDAAIAPNRRND